MRIAQRARALMGWRGKAALAAVVGLVAARGAAAATLSVSETATRVRIREDRFDVRLVVRNSTGATLGANVVVELLDPNDVVCVESQQHLTIATGLQALDVALRPGVSSLKAAERFRILHYRLRYRLELDHAPLGAPGQVTGILAVSRLTPDAFELHSWLTDTGQAGRPLHVVVQAAHPVTLHPLSGVVVKARLVLDEDKGRAVSSSRTTDARGLAVFDLPVPPDVENGRSAELKLVGRTEAFTAEVSRDVHLIRLASVLVSTDKPLYQPGQMLHIRALVRGWENGPALADAFLKVKVTDEGNDPGFEGLLKTSRFGIATFDWPIPEYARLGRYVAEVEIQEDRSSFQGSGAAIVKVSRYELPQFGVRAVPDRPYYLPGQKPRLEVRADYVFGKPVTRGHVRVALETRRAWNYKQQRFDVEERASQEGSLSESGRYAVSFDLSEDDFPSGESWSLYSDIEGTAYVTDATTGRTEEGRFTLRATRDPIHLYLVERYAEPCPGKEDRICWASFYVSATYADGTPASCEVRIARRIQSTDYEAQGLPPRAEFLTSVRTNRFGLAKVPGRTIEPLEPATGESQDEPTRLILTARDGDGRVGRQVSPLGRWWSSRLLVESGQTVHAPGQPVEVTIRSRSVRGPVLLDLVLADQVLASRVVSLRGSSATVAFPYEPRFRGALSVVATPLVTEGDYRSRLDPASHGILYPTEPELRVDVKADRATHRPGEEAQVRVGVRRGNGRPAPGVLGVVVLDRAVEERAARERGLDQAGFLAPFRNEESLAGISLRRLLAIDTREPIPEGLDLVAEVLLGQQGLSERTQEGSEAFERDTAAVFRSHFAAQLSPVAEALRRFQVEDGGPGDLKEVTRTLDEAGVSFGPLRDPWDRPYHITVGPRDAQRVVEVGSDGPDKLPNTSDDLVALTRAWAYFAPRGRLIDRAARLHYEKAGGPIRDLETLRTELAALGEDLGAWRDPWDHPFTFEFEIAGPFAVITSKSMGPNGERDLADRRPSDDVTLSTVRTEYFAREKHRIQEALDGLFQESAEFPQSEDGWAKVLARAGLAPGTLRDPWGRPVEILFRRETAYANRVTIRSYDDREGNRRKRTEEAPVSRAIEIISLRSGGPDAETSQGDDFDLATFRRTVAEQESAVKAPSPGSPIVLASGTGAVAGTVTDSSGSVLPGARVEARDEVTRRQWEGLTDREGAFVLKGLAPGFYLVSTSLSGFKTALVTRVPVEAGQTTQLDVSLAVGEMVEAVTVSAESPTFGTRSAESGAAVERSSQTAHERPPVATPRVRRDFPETLSWQPALETDAAGNALVRFKLADTITTWKLLVVASTVGGQVATAEREVLAFQPFFVENEPPPILTTGDAIGLPALVRNYTDEPFEVTVDAEAGDGLRIAGSARQVVPVPAGDSARTTFDLRAEQAAQKARVVLKAVSSKAADAVEKAVRVHPNGAETDLASGLLVDRDAVLDLAIPDHAIPGSIQAELRIAPHLATHVFESVEAVMSRPSGCAEQAISAAYPSLMALRLVAGGGGAKAGVSSRARRYLDLGYQSLLGHQAASGGFSYFRGQEADVALTAYALRFLTDAAPLLEVDEDALDRARSYLLKGQERDGRWRAHSWYATNEDEERSTTLTALIARTLASLPESKAKAVVGGKERATVRDALDRALAYLDARSEERDDPYGLASLALAAHAAQASREEGRALERLRALVHQEAGGSYWAQEANTPFFGWGRAGRVEITALAVKALAASGEVLDRALVDRGLLFLLRNRDRYGIWWSSQATVNVLDALVSQIGARPEATGVDTLDVTVNGRKVETLTLPADPQDAGPLAIDLSPHVGPGSNRIELRRPHESGKISAQAAATYYVPWAQAQTRTSDSLRFDVRFDKTEVPRAEGIEVHVEAERVGFRGYGMLLAEIGLPPGVDVDRESLDRAVAASGYSFCRYDVQPDRVVAYLWPRAGGVAFDFVVRPRLSMRAQSAASTLSDYYNPDAAVTLPPRNFVVRE